MSKITLVHGYFTQMDGAERAAIALRVQNWRSRGEREDRILQG